MEEKVASIMETGIMYGAGVNTNILRDLKVSTWELRYPSIPNSRNPKP